MLEKCTRLIFSPAGAYNNTQGLQFTECRPAVVMIGLKSEIEVIREQENLTDWKRRERLPERLKLGGNKNGKVNLKVSNARQAKDWVAV